MPYLSRISGPADLRQFSERELTLLADEIRDEILTCVSEVGGHLAASLGTVELTVALHSMLESPRDSIVWDVGHQCYAHKLLTGRRDRFRTIRQYQGLSGFPCRAESVHDIAGTGHASTSLSYGLGLVESARLAGEHGRTVVCVLGDGALTGGVAFEALNQAGHLRTPLVVVLNDNQMSIQPNVGALQLYLNRIRLDPTISRLREELERSVARIPAIGAQAYRLGKDIKESVKALLVPGMIFEELGFAYIGVVDGHDMHALRTSIGQAIETRRPVVIHVKTIKGKGYEPAEAHPDDYHGTAPFHLGNGERKKSSVGTTYTEAFGQALVRLAEQDERIVAITAAMTQGTGLGALPGTASRAASTTSGSRRSTPPFLLQAWPSADLQAGRRHLLDLPAASLRHAGAGHWAPAPAGGLRARPRRPGRRRRANPSRRLRSHLPSGNPELHRHGARDPGGPAADARHGSDRGWSCCSAVPSRPGRAVGLASGARASAPGQGLGPA